MPRIQTLVSGTLRSVAVVLGGAAVSVLVQTRVPAERMPPATEPDVFADAALAAADNDRFSLDDAPDTDSDGWRLYTNGWTIRFDGADVDFPTVAEAFADRPRSIPQVRLSAYDPLVQYYARKAGFDWRLIVAIIYSESRFNPHSRSHKGAYGLMQVRSIAARAVGEKAFQQPADNIRTGVRYLRKLEEHFPDAYGRDRLFLMLAAYNAGPGHIRDAQQLARESGLDPNRWFGGVRDVLPALENPRVYRYLTHGYARGRSVVAYVEGTWEKFLEYQRLTVAGIFPGPDPRSSPADVAGEARSGETQG